MTIPARAGLKRGKPVAIVKQGSAAVPIYRGMCRGRVRFTVAFYLNGRRQRRTFGNLESARDEARLVALNIQRGMSAHNDLRPEERENYLAAVRLLEPFKLPLVSAVEEWAECRRALGGVSPMIVIRDYLERNRGVEPGVCVPRVVVELLDLKRRDRVCGPYIGSLSGILKRFAEAFPGEIGRVTGSEIERWLRHGNHAAVTRNIWLKRIKNLFAFAKRSGYLPRHEPTAAESLKPAREAETEVGIFTSEAMRRLLEAASPETMPFLAIGGFAGMRVAEICRLDWSAVCLDRRLIELRANQAKTASRRLVPISDNLAAWLALADRNGPVVPEKCILERSRSLARRLGIGWPHNALRHSYISYRIAEVKNAAQVALEAGNSPAIIFKHYRELVTEEEARAWFGIYPAGSVDNGNGAS